MIVNRYCLINQHKTSSWCLSKYRYIIILAVMAAAFPANAQIYSYNKEVKPVYKVVLKSIDYPSKISRYTQKPWFKITRFQPKQSDTNNIKPLNSKSWNEFLNSIDTTKIKDYNWNGRDLKKHKLRFLFSRWKTKLTFGSPVFSDTLNMSVVYLDSYNGPENASGVLYYLERRGKKWIVVRTILVYIS